MVLKFLLVINLLTFSLVKCSSNEAIDTNLLENVLDAEECSRQTSAIRTSLILGMQFADAGIRTPRGMLTGNSIDLGNYHQCLAIEHQMDDMHIQGKYCSINVPMDQSFEVSGPEERNAWSTFNPSSLILDKALIARIKEYNLYQKQIQALIGDTDALEDVEKARTIPENPLSGSVFTLAVCIPKPCTTEQAINSLLFNVTTIGFNYTDNYCRLRGDKPWSGADTAAAVVFSLIGFLTVISTCYDLGYRFIFKKDMKKVNSIYQACSIYTNSQRLITFNPGPGNLNCMDGIRAISMMWVVLGHSFGSESQIANPFDSWMWMVSANALWVSIATVVVDTFFALSGILIIYTTAGKMSGTTLLKNLHWFYIGRIVRITPLLAVTVLLQASYFNHMADGPLWRSVERATNRCRARWWSTLLNIQNLLNPRAMCAGHLWYVAIDVQLYIISPLVIFWVLGKRRRNAWMALIIGLLAVLVASTIYNFHLNLQAGTIVPSRGSDSSDYMAKYYFNTMTRASPFFVGLIFGYILHIHRGKKIQVSWVFSLLWACAAAIVACIIYFKYSIKQFDWDNQFMDNFMNSFMRPAWAVAVGLVILACVHGYGGRVDWFLSLNIWRLPARLSYGMYLLHYPTMFSINGTMIVPVYFTVGLFVFKFLSHLALSIVMSFFFTVLVDSPISALYKQLLIRFNKKSIASTKMVTRNDADGGKNNTLNIDKKNNDVFKNNDSNGPAITIK